MGDNLDLKSFLLGLESEAGLALGEAVEIVQKTKAEHWLRNAIVQYDRVKEVVRGIVSQRLREEQRTDTAAIAAAKKAALSAIDSELRLARLLGATKAQLAEPMARRAKIQAVVPHEAAHKLAGNRRNEFWQDAIASLPTNDAKIIKKGDPRKWASAHAMAWVAEEVMNM